MAASYIEVAIAADSSVMDELSALMGQLGFEGFWEEGETLRCFISTARWNPDMKAEVERMATMLVRSSSSVTPRVSVRPIEDQNWNAEWEKTIQPIRVSDRIVIRPSWHDYAAEPNQIVLVIDPKMSFGTGYHETTRLTLRLLEKHTHTGMRVLDIGTGTGVLAIASVKLGAAQALGVDVDEWSYSNALENARLNEVENAVAIRQGELHDVKETGFDMIVANIQRNVLEPLLPGMKARLTPRGIILLSGLLESDEQPMIDAIHAAGFRLIEELQEGEWIALAAFLP
ncbi:MAG: 50S ribosomal protein L11 methyltransferase [Bacteroidota bacterium]